MTAPATPAPAPAANRPSPVAPDAGAIRQYLLTLHGPEPQGWLACWVRQTKATRAFDLRREGALEAAVKHLARAASTCDVYTGVCLLRSAPPPGSRGKADDAISVPGLWVDLDVQGEAHRQTSLPPDVETALGFLRGAAPEPSLVVHSGHGLQAFWLFPEPFLIECDEERARISNLVRRWQAMLLCAARRHGWTIDSTHDLARVLRPAGTVNRKIPGDERLVTVIASGRRYQVSELEEILGPDDASEQRSKPNGHAAEGASDDAIQRAAELLAAAWPGEGLRNACFLALAGACARGGIPQEVAEDLAEAIYERLWPHHPDRHQARAEVRATYRKFAAGEEVTGYNTLREFVGEQAAGEAMRLLGAKPKLHVITGGREGEPDLLAQRATDAGNGERLFALHGQDYLYVGDWGTFVVWDGRRWIEDKRNLMLDRVRDTARALYRQASHLEGDRRIEMAKLSAKLESQSGAAGALKFAAAIQDSVVLSNEFDSDPFLLNCLNGTIDLRTGELRPHDRKDRMLKLVPVEYDPSATCPRWEQFLAEVFEPHPDVLPWIQKAIGYSLTGSVREQVFFLCWGRGCNGKGTLLNTLAELAGDYGTVMDIRSLADIQTRPDTPSEYVARLHGARFAKAEEPSDNFVLNEGLIKWVTGDDPLRARRLYQNSFQFQPTHKIWIATNPKPAIRGTDIAIWRRVRFIPFETCFYGREDKGLRDALRRELPGILRWAVEGAIRWHAEGLGDCETVAEATQAYRDECDQVSRFVAECCYVGPTATVKARPLYQAYREWATSGGEHPFSDKRFSARLLDRGFDKKHTATGTVYFGLGLLLDKEGA